MKDPDFGFDSFDCRLAERSFGNPSIGNLLKQNLTWNPGHGCSTETQTGHGFTLVSKYLDFKTTPARPIIEEARPRPIELSTFWIQNEV